MSSSASRTREQASRRRFSRTRSSASPVRRWVAPAALPASGSRSSRRSRGHMGAARLQAILLGEAASSPSSCLPWAETPLSLRGAAGPRTLRGVRGRRQAVEIVFDHATKRYPGRAAPAVDDLTLSIPAGDVCCLVGPSGGGKTTAMKLVNRLVELTSGDVQDRRAERRRRSTRPSCAAASAT